MSDSSEEDCELSAQVFEHSSTRALEMHCSISADRWCITKADLRDVAKRVKMSILDGSIQPTLRDAFDKNDLSIGPSVYTVNEQFIKPITKAAGKMSWALMVHPLGLKCDLFVTHAWQEGIFEFIDKVLHSWPRPTFHAWCCMFANPQLLDISSFISNPSCSPFAIALRSSSHVLVVPNSSCSIYTRLWCVYEAYLASETDKIILTATSPTLQPCLWAMFFALLAAFAGACIAFIQLYLCGGFDAPLSVIGACLQFAFLVIHVGFALSLVVSRPKVRQVIHLGSTLMIGYWAIVACTGLYEIDSLVIHCGSRSMINFYQALPLEVTFQHLFYYMIAETDRIRSLAYSAGALQLHNGYTYSAPNCNKSQLQ
eukprot:TRINITY_DN5035_c1_g1_i2.p1 TRINITY_DN5035_c1_g1~~TRINITY_DN5035_c1_g1_i2.p1  ORF type:complete len:378 (+),score=40.35 TRINITY_DN5035_c1_g1_i2:27-1136(+)